VAEVSKYCQFAFVKTHRLVFAHRLKVIALDDFIAFAILNTTIYNEWAWKYCSTMGGSLLYTPSTAFETYPFPEGVSEEVRQRLEEIGSAYHAHRSAFMLRYGLGLTKTYNLFHADAIRTEAIHQPSPSVVSPQATTDDKQIAWLHKHLTARGQEGEMEAVVAAIAELRRLHVMMDAAVLTAYGWQDIALSHNFYEVDYLPENDRLRFTISPAARKEVLKRLLQLNHQRAGVNLAVW
jgi:hypothetical protein